MIQFYAPDIATNPVLPESDSQHCCRVLRMKAGDEIEVIDGKGNRYTCAIVDPHSKHTLVEVRQCAPAPLSWNHFITVAVAPTKHIDRMEWMVEKLTEIGVNRIIPLLCDRSERKDIKVDRLNKIAVAAMKQSLKAVVPEILPMTPFKVAADIAAGQKFIAYCDRSLPRLLLAKEYRPATSATVFIGPEGDFSPEEINLAINDRGFTPVSLGNNRLRTETAALFACSTFHILDMAAE
jgi:16S rRNA (uracil1498-N3)-methyltransferase